MFSLTRPLKAGVFAGFMGLTVSGCGHQAGVPVQQSSEKRPSEPSAGINEQMKGPAALPHLPPPQLSELRAPSASSLSVVNSEVSSPSFTTKTYLGGLGALGEILFYSLMLPSTVYGLWARREGPSDGVSWTISSGNMLVFSAATIASGATNNLPMLCLAALGSTSMAVCAWAGNGAGKVWGDASNFERRMFKIAAAGCVVYGALAVVDPSRTLGQLSLGVNLFVNAIFVGSFCSSILARPNREKFKLFEKIAWPVALGASVSNLFAVPNLNLSNLLVPISFVLANATIVTTLFYRFRQLPQANGSSELQSKG